MNGKVFEHFCVNYTDFWKLFLRNMKAFIQKKVTSTFFVAVDQGSSG